MEGKSVRLQENPLNTPKAVLVTLVLIIALNVALYFYLYEERLLAAQGEASPATEASPRSVPQRESTSVVELTMAPLGQQAAPKVSERTDATLGVRQ